jgi:hypothetical protein
MTTLTIAADTTALTSAYSTTLASLPESFTGTGDPESADVVHLSGAGDWARRAVELIEHGIKALIVSDPRATDSGEIRRLMDAAEEHSVAVELAEPYAGDPALVVHAPALEAHLAALSALVITENHPDPTPETAAFSIARLGRALGRAITLTSVRTHGQAVFINGTAEGLPIEGAITRSRADVHQRIQGLGFGRTIDIRLIGASNARPGEITVATMAGETRAATIYETAERTAWRRLHRTLAARQHENTSLTGFAADLDAVRAKL